MTVSIVVAGNAFALPREEREQGRDRERAIVKMVKRIVRALGDGLTIPRP